jgi:hypothetical protein
MQRNAYTVAQLKETLDKQRDDAVIYVHIAAPDGWALVPVTRLGFDPMDASMIMLGADVPDTGLSPYDGPSGDGYDGTEQRPVLRLVPGAKGT